VREYVDGNSLLSYTFNVCWRNRRHVGKKHLFLRKVTKKTIQKWSSINLARMKSVDSQTATSFDITSKKLSTNQREKQNRTLFIKPVSSVPWATYNRKLDRVMVFGI